MRTPEQKERDRERALRYYYEHREECNRKRVEARRNRTPEQKERARGRVAEWRQKPERKEDARQRSVEWRRNNPERHRENVHRYYREHREECICQKVEYKRKHPERMRQYSRAYDSSIRAARYQASGKITGSDIRHLLQQQNEKCAICQILFPPAGVRNRYHIDHIVALSNGGSNELGNIQLLCPKCNVRKGGKNRRAQV